PASHRRRGRDDPNGARRGNGEARRRRRSEHSEASLMNRIVGVLLTAALPGAVAVAAEEHAAHAAPSLDSLLLPTLNFATFAVLFWYYAWPLVVGALAERRKLAEKEISEADETSRAAGVMIADIEARRSGLRETGDPLGRW